MVAGSFDSSTSLNIGFSMLFSTTRRKRPRRSRRPARSLSRSLARRELLLLLSLAEAVGCDEWSLAAATVLRDAGTIETVLEAKDRGALRRDYQAVLGILKAELAGEQWEGTKPP